MIQRCQTNVSAVKSVDFVMSLKKEAHFSLNPLSFLWCCCLCTQWAQRGGSTLDSASSSSPVKTTCFLSFLCRLFVCLPPSCHIFSTTVTSATWGQLFSHVPHFHPQHWSHMFVKTCMLCAFSGPICSHAFSPMSPALPGGPGRSLTLFIQSEQLGPS